MKLKVLAVGGILILSQIVISCICNCPKWSTFEHRYKGVSVTAYDTSGFNPVEANGKVYKNAFGLGISVNFDSTPVASLARNCNIGFAQATACSCPDDEFLYPDPIENMRIKIHDLDNDKIVDVTSLFRMRSYDDEVITVEQFFEQRAEWHDGFQTELSEYETMPNSVVFIVGISLESGKTFENQTDEIRFFE